MRSCGHMRANSVGGCSGLGVIGPGMCRLCTKVGGKVLVAEWSWIWLARVDFQWMVSAFIMVVDMVVGKEKRIDKHFVLPGLLNRAGAQ